MTENVPPTGVPAAECPPSTQANTPAGGFDAYEVNSFHQQDRNAGKVITLLLCTFFFYTVVVTLIAGWWTLASLR